MRDEFPFEESRPKLIERWRWLLAVFLVLFIAGAAAVFYWYYWLPKQKEPKPNSTKRVHGTISTLLNNPLDVAIFQDNVYVSDANNHRVVAFLKSGAPLFSFSGKYTHGLKGADLVYPGGIAVNSQGDIYVADVNGGKVVVFNTSGRALRLLKLPGSDRAVLKPLAVAVDKKDRVYVSEASSGNIYQYDREENLLRTFGKGKLSFANGIAVNAQGDIYVADSNNQKIVVFNQAGKHIKTIRRKKGDKSFLPRGLAFDNKGDLLVADTLGSQIIEFDSQGRERDSWGAPGSGGKQFNFPHGIAYSEGNLYIVDRGNDRLVIWQHLQ